mmetsp:Transcript_16986/g.28725  ORF Transcript_16986/g.28725 Transcript_16986/m.28725 type:complete len:106 (+) Transcript_16986:131-448(+)
MNKSICPSLTLRTRVYGWAICLSIGFLVSLLSSGLLKSLSSGKIIKFAIFYTVGTIASLSSSMFLWGPRSQCKSMFDKTRCATTVIYLLCIAGVIACIVLVFLDF